ncbi:MAG: peptidoglycan editing factor PgeF [Muribaculaceae bacterium]|nr:peptidoglycan editing factor PgeF [Muribaculaceae bacterium]
MLTEGIFRRLDLPGCVAVTTLRGEASGAYGEFNACHYTGDDPAHVDVCRLQLARYFGVGCDRLVIPRQTHSVDVKMVVAPVLSAGDLDAVDGLVSVERGVVLCVNTADCVPVLMCDPEAKIIAAVHSGWRGTVGRIAERAVAVMVAAGADPSRIHAVMGPSICVGCFEVGRDVAEKFYSVFGSAAGGIVEERGSDRPHVDLARAIAVTLRDAGVRDENILLPDACSHCDGSPYFSARRHGVDSGRTLTAVMLR